MPRGSAASNAAEGISRLIGAGAYRSGDQLPPERELATTLGVGRPALREGIKRLIAARILEARRGSGTYVAQIDLADVFAVRLNLEPLAASLAAGGRTESEAQQLLVLHRELKEALPDPEKFAAKDLAVHALVAHAARNQVLEDMLGNLTELTKLSRWVSVPSAGTRGSTVRDIGELIRAIGHGEEGKAASAMRRHLQTVQDTVAISAAGADHSGELDVLLHTEQVFEPPPEFAAQANASDPSIYERAAADPETWWASWAEKLDWIESWDQILDWSDPPFAKWFEGGKLNASVNCLDRHVDAGRGDRVAFYWEGEDATRAEVTYAGLLDQTQRIANVLRGLGVGKGDVVGIYMPMIPEAAAAILGCARIGAIHNVVFGGFSAESVRERMAISGAKALITADATLRRGVPLPMKSAIDAVAGSLEELEHIIVVDRCGTDPPMTAGRDLFWHEVVPSAEPVCAPETMESEDPLFILYTSGSTAKPKGILHTTGGYLTGVSATHKLVFDLKDDDVYWCAADIGWVTGHSYIIYGPLVNGATSVMYEGAMDYPAEDRWWEIVERYRATIFYTAPTAIRSCMKCGDHHPAAHDLSSLRLLGSVGEPINPRAWLWYHQHIGGGRCPIVDTWWQTETGAIMISPLPGLTATKPGSATVPLPGIEAKILDSEDREVSEGGGNLVLTRPWPSMARTIYGEPERFVETYWKRYGRETYLVGDAAKRDEDGYFWVLGRIDDVLNVSGHRLSTMEVESALVGHPKVAEAAVIGTPDELTGEAIIAFVTPQDGVEDGPELESELCEHVAERIGRVSRPKTVVLASDLPKTRSGKIMRRLLRDIAAGNELGDVSTLRDPAAVEQLQQRFDA